ncbi:MAG TPA: cell division FtsA domain-containing protein [Candidatus Dormibacteraeota bacterium]|nr:cell division FtsA domain-containing protein [Candidatus Dormibacteraeota bacterium]
MSGFRLLKRKEDYYRHFTAVDIGTDQVKALVVRRTDGTGEILGVGREPQAHTAMSGGAIADIGAVIMATNRAMEAAEDMAGVVPGQSIVGVAGELVNGFSSSISYPREMPDRQVKQAELRVLLQQVHRRALREAQHLLELERGYGPLEARLVHSAVTNVRMDGYQVANPLGFTGRNLEVTVFNTFAPLTHVGAIESVVKELDLEMIGAVAQPYAVARACAGQEAWEQGGVFVDIGGGTTDVALLRDGGVEGTRMFNMGGRSFTRRIAQSTGLSQEEAEIRKIRHGEGLLPPDDSLALSALLSGDVEVLLQGLNLCLKELSRGERLPGNIYLCGGGSLLPEILTGVNQSRWADGLPFSHAPHARLLTPADVIGISDSTGQLASPRDVGPMSLAVHALKLDAEFRDPVSILMKGVLKRMKS